MPEKESKSVFNKSLLKNNIVLVFLYLVTSVQAVYAGEIIRLTKNNLNLLPKGKEVDGMIGDWVMKNGKVIAVIGHAYPDREANQMVSSVQGAVIDFTSLAQNNDQLTVYYPQGARVDVPSADTIIIIASTGKTVQLKAVKYATATEPFIAETTYSLTDNDEFLQVATTYKNGSASPIKILMYDVLRCDNGLEDITPAGNNNLAFVYNKWYHSAYGVLSKERGLFTPSTLLKRNLVAQGHRIFFEGFSNKPQDSVTLDAGGELSISRMLLTGESVAHLQQQQLANTAYKGQAVNVTVTDKKGKRLQDVFVTGRNGKKEIVSSAITGADGTAALYLTEGNYKIDVFKVGHDTASEEVVIHSSPETIAFTLRPETIISFQVNGPANEAIPVKVEFRGVNGTKNPQLGPGTRSNGVQNLYYANSRHFSVPVPEGSYQVIVSHGPEYGAEVIKISAVAGADAKVSVTMKRAFSTPHYIIGDLHNHTTGSGDSNADIESRVINMAASGIEFAPATEHNRITTYSGVIKKLGLQKYMASAAGIELSGRPGPGNTNHQIGFPLTIQPDKRGYGAPKTDKDPYVQIKRLYDYDGGKFKLMQQNHPDISQLYFDKNGDGIRDKGYGTEQFTHVMEIRESMLDLPEAVNGGDANTRSFQWLQMLNLGYKIFGTANTDAHAVGNATGSMFNYIYTNKDTPETIDAVDIAHQVKSGRLIMSNGPFMTVSVNKALPGDEIKAVGGKVAINIHILTSNWCTINTVQILVNGKSDSTLTFTKKKSPALFPAKTEAFKKELSLTLKNDAHIIVLAYGENESVGLVNGGKKMAPIAVSNPIFVDADGAGFTPNNDMLGQPLPAKGSNKPVPSDE